MVLRRIMTDRYHVIIVDRNQFDMDGFKEEGKNEYDLYEMYQNGEDLPDGVWFEEWLVPDGESWDSHDLYNHHDLVEEDSYVIDWNEVGTPWKIKDEKWWEQTIKYLQQMHTVMESIYPLANEMIEKVIDLLDPEQETLNDAMQGEIVWRDVDTLGHWLWMAETREDENNAS